MNLTAIAKRKRRILATVVASIAAFLLNSSPAALGQVDSSNTNAAGPQKIVPGALWPDDRGEHIQAHGGGIIKLGDTGQMQASRAAWGAPV